MEVKEFHNLRYFEVIHHGNWYHINSPLLENGLKTFKEKRLFYQRFKMLEKKLDKPWSARTNISNMAMRRIFRKIGAIPCYEDYENGKVYYFKPEKENEGL